uniref:THADA_3 protein n=1 Tax=Fopius arisanus TaxID=64838 RepID=A0A0C9QBU6_9HYME
MEPYLEPFPMGGYVFNSRRALEDLVMKKSRGEDVSKTLRDIVAACRTCSWDHESFYPLIVELLILIASKDHQDEEALLSGRIIFRMLTVRYSQVKPRAVTHQTLELLKETDEIELINVKIVPRDPELFKLIIIDSYLSMTKMPGLIQFFPILQRHCGTYTKYTFLAFRLLKRFLISTRGTDFWNQLNEPMEGLGPIACEIRVRDLERWNPPEIFRLYQSIKQGTELNFLEEFWRATVKDLSWENSMKFMILSAMVSVLESPPTLNYLDIRAIVESFPKSHLKHPSTKLYFSLLGRMSQEDWWRYFGRSALSVVKSWEKEEHWGALQLIWDLWFRPTFLKFNRRMLYLIWPNLSTCTMFMSQSFFLKLVVEKNYELYPLFESGNLWEAINIWNKGKIVYLSHPCEYVRLNGFAICCRGGTFMPCHKDNDYEICKVFLYYNSRTASARFRKEFLDSFKILIKRISKRPLEKEETDFSEYLRRFVLNCFEPGSCYQRKIIGLSIYEILQKSSNFCPWTSTDKRSFWALARLCLDSINEISSMACDICLQFSPKIIDEDAEVLHAEGLTKFHSENFYEISGGMKLLKISCRWLNTSKSLLEEAKLHLKGAKMLRIYGSLMAMLDTLSVKADILKQDHVQELVEFLEETSNFFLLSLSPNPGTQYSSSFAEMGIAIEAIITNSGMIDESTSCMLSPAHQTILSCIWMSLATISEFCEKLTCINSLGGEIYIRLIDIVVRILMRCRHKGAIEAAGVALGRMTSNNNLGAEYFQGHLENLLSLDSRNEVDVTRRGAGQTIIFHKLICFRDQNKRPLLHTAVAKILQDLRDSPETRDNYRSNSKNDHPIARQLHFLKSAVRDKSLNQNFLEYLEEIFLICLMHLKSTEWTIRNASLQLLGAIIPRVVGQDESECSVEHFFTHYRRFAGQTLQELRSRDCHVAVMAVLTLLSKMTVSNENLSEDFRRDIIRELRELFQDKVIGVRNLVAKTFAAFVNSKDVPEVILKMTREERKDRNYNHCLFMTLEHLMTRARCEGTGKTETVLEATKALLRRLQGLLDLWTRGRLNIDYIVETAFLQCLLASPQLTNSPCFEAQGIEEVLSGKIQQQEDRPGFWEFIDHLIEIQVHFGDQSFGKWVVTGTRYDIYVMKHPKIVETHRDDRKIQVLASAFREISAILEGNSALQAYGSQIIKFVIEILEKCREINIEDSLRVDYKGIILKLIDHSCGHQKRLGYLLVVLTLFDKYEYQTKTLNFILYTIRNDDDSGKFWAVDCLQKCREKIPDFSSLENNIKLIIYASFAALMNDEIPEIRETANKVLMEFQILDNPPGEYYKVNHLEQNVHRVLLRAIFLFPSLYPLDRREQIQRDFVEDVLNIPTRHPDSRSNFENTYTDHVKFCDIIHYVLINYLPSFDEDEIDITTINETGIDYLEGFVNVRKQRDVLSSYLNCPVWEWVDSRICLLNRIIRGDKNPIVFL